MSKQLKLRRGTTAQHSTFTGAEGEVTVDTTKDTLVVHDGVTAGGKPVLTESNPSYTGTLTGGTGVVNLGSGQFYKDASGNVGIGTTNTAGAALTIARGSGVNGFLEVGGNGNAATGSTMLIGQDSTGSAYCWQRANSVLLLGTNNAERARIDSSGNLLVNAAAQFNSCKFGVQAGLNSFNGIAIKNTDGFGGNFQNFVNSAGTVAGAIIHSGTTSITYGTSSDYRLKENIQPMIGALGKVAALKPVTYDWKSDGVSAQGFIAHELAEVVPDCVVGEKDAVDADGNPKYQQIDTSFLVATLTAAIQEQQAIITSLTARVTALETPPSNEPEQGGV